MSTVRSVIAIVGVVGGISLAWSVDWRIGVALCLIGWGHDNSPHSLRRHP